jgi:hypothetical protein
MEPLPWHKSDEKRTQADWPVLASKGDAVAADDQVANLMPGNEGGQTGQLLLRVIFSPTS